MNSQTMRAAIENCQSNNLDVMVYKRPDGSVIAIRCIPKPEDVTKSVIIRPRTSMPLIRLFSENYEEVFNPNKE